MVHLLLALVLTMTGGEDSSAVTTIGSYTVPIVISDTSGHQFGITFGVDPKATYGFDMSLGEEPIPPPPTVSAFDIRFLDPLQRKMPYNGMGAYLDVRPYVSRTQVDTFYVRFQPNNDSFPMTITWPVKIKDAVDSACVIFRSAGSLVRINMLKERAVRVVDGTVNTCIIVTYGVKPPLPKKKWRGEG